MRSRILAVIILLYALSVVAQPPQPSGYYGTVTVNGDPAQVGVEISAWINGVNYPTNFVVNSAGQYGIMSVNGDDPSTTQKEGGVNNETVLFKIKIGNDYYDASPSSVWETGVNHQVNLIADTGPDDGMTQGFIYIQTQTGIITIKLSDIVNITFTDSDNETMTDIDGNTYKTVKIGNQVWMAENLKVTHYRNGDAIPNLTNINEWWSSNTGSYCNYNNDANLVATYGRLYNWYAVVDNRNLAPQGWHVPSDEEWKQLEMNLGMSQVEADRDGNRSDFVGGKLKADGTDHWTNPNLATNESGFTALPGGFRSYRWGGDTGIGEHAFFWSSTEQNSSFAWYRHLVNNGLVIGRDYYLTEKESGFSVRCIKD